MKTKGKKKSKGKGSPKPASAGDVRAMINGGGPVPPLEIIGLATTADPI